MTKNLPPQKKNFASVIAQALILILTPCVTYATLYPYLLRDEENSIDSGSDATLAINPNGTVLEWDPYGAPHRVEGLSSIVAVSTGGGLKMALRADGSVWTWGFGYLGRGLSPYEHPAGYGDIPLQVPGLENIIAISAGAQHALALKSDGTVWAWGANYSGEVGNGYYYLARTWTPEELAWIRDQKIPYQMPITSAVGIAAGDTYSLILKADGTVWGCGEGNSGQLSQLPPYTGFDVFYTTLVQVPGINNVKKIAAGANHAIALRNDSSVWTWGSNRDGQLGDGGAHDVLVYSPELNSDVALPRIVSPRAVPGLTGVTKISAGKSHSVIQKADGSIWAWGEAAGSMLIYSAPVGEYIIRGRNAPIQVDEASQAVALTGSPCSFGVYASFLSPGPSADIRKMETDALTVGAPPPSTPPRMRLGSCSVPLDKYESDKRPRAQLFSGPYVYALDDLGSVFAWGSQYSATPTSISTISGVVSLNAGAANSYVAPFGNYDVLTIALLTTGELVKWRPYIAPPIPAIPFTTINGINNVVAITGGIRSATHALRRDGSVWILNGSGTIPTQQATIGSASPNVVNVSSLTNVIQLAGGATLCLALKKDGTVWGWGSNNGGTLGNNPTSFIATPSQLPGLTQVKSIYVKDQLGYAIKEDGSVWAWGSGYPGNGQNMYNQKLPLQITQLQGAVSIGSGYAINGNGSVLSWGSSNSYGTLGLGEVNSAAFPTLISGLNNVTEVNFLNMVGLFRLENGLIYSCGSNEGVGLLGTGSLNGPKAKTPLVTLF